MTVTATPDMAATDALSVADARAMLEQLLSAEITFSRRWLSERDELAQAQTAAGDSALEDALGTGNGTPRAVNLASDARAALEATEAAIEAARRRRREAIPRLWQAEAAELRERAVTLREEADAIDAKIEPLLAQLREIGCCDWGPIALVRDSLTGQKHRAPGTSRAGLLRGEAIDLERRAQTVELKKVPCSGTFEQLVISDADAILAALEGHGPTRIGPSLPAVLGWAEALIASTREQRRRVPRHAANWRAEDAPVLTRLVWRDGALDPRQSAVLG